MKKTIYLCIIILLYLYVENKGQDVRAMWLWGESTDIIVNAEAREDFFNFCSNPPGFQSENSIPANPRPINRVYFNSTSYVRADSARRAKLHAFLKEAHQHGIQIEYLDGSPDWATTNKSIARQHLEYVFQFNSETDIPEEKFDGIQFDVEPYLLSGWSEQSTRLEIWNSYINLISEVQAKVDSVNDETYFGVAIPRWYDSKPGINYLHNLIDIVDYIAIMNYVDSKSRLINDASTEIDYANTIPGKKVIVGVETKGVEPETVSFNEEGWGNMESMLFEMDKSFRNKISYAGIAIHAYTYYRKLSQFGIDSLDITPPSLIDINIVSADNTNYLDFYCVDITGIGLDEEASIEDASIFKMIGNSKLELPGHWEDGGENHLLFYPDSINGLEGYYEYVLSLVDSAGNRSTIDDSIKFDVSYIESDKESNHLNFNLYQNYPNPFNPKTKIKYSLSVTSEVNLKIFDVLGNEIAVIDSGRKSPGEYEAEFEGSNISSGIYFCVLNIGENRLSRKLCLIK